MRITFLGVGEACDPEMLNTSLLVCSEIGVKKHYILLDCGFTTPHCYFRKTLDADALDAVRISHFHGDHFFGMPLLLLRFWEMRRTVPLTIIGQAGVREKVEAALDLAYPGFGARLQFPIEYRSVECGSELSVCGFTACFAANIHSAPCLALRLTDKTSSMFYSGDGQPTGKSLSLAAGCDLVVHEAYRFNGQTPNHGSVAGAMDFARQARARRLALVHIAHYERAACGLALGDLQGESPAMEILLPEPGDLLAI